MTPPAGSARKTERAESKATAETTSLLSDDELMVGVDPEVITLYAYQRQVLGYLLHGRSLRSSDTLIGASNLTTFSSNASDLLIYSPTGFGKTLTYIAPITHFLKTTKRGGDEFCIDRRPDGVAALILVPTRELANQVFDLVKPVLHKSGPTLVVVNGGLTFEEEVYALQKTSSGLNGPDVVICVAGRLGAHAKPTSQRGDSCRWNCLRYLVIDEADRLLADGYGDWITALRCMTSEQDMLRGAKTSDTVAAARERNPCLLMDFWQSAYVPDVNGENTNTAQERPIDALNSDFMEESVCDSSRLSSDAFVRPFNLQKIICTATDVKSFRGIRSLRLYHPLCVRARLEKDSLKQEVVLITTKTCSAEESLNACVSKILGRRKHQCLLFCGSAAEVHKIYRSLSIHLFGDDPQASGVMGFLTGTDSAKHRDRTFRAFLSGAIRLLVSSDVSARGLNVKSVSHVVQFGLPLNADEYIHRVGRTARCGKKGKSILIVRKREVAKFLKMQKTIVELRPTSKIKIKRI